MKKLLNKKGFTLIELIVVIAILAVLALILVPSVMNYVTQAQNASKLANARSAYSTAALDVATEERATLAAVKTATVAALPGLDADLLNICGTVVDGQVTLVTGVYYDGQVFPENATCAAPVAP